MKTQKIKKQFVIIFMASLGMIANAQDSIAIKKKDTIANVEKYYFPTCSQIFSLSPISKKVHLVNGLAIGAGHFENSNVKFQKINGINIEANPNIILVPLLIMFNPVKAYEDSGLGVQISDTIVKPFYLSNKMNINGLNISTGSFMIDTDFNGLNISTFNMYQKFNGVNIAPIFSSAQKMNGVSFSLVNVFNNFNGLSVGLINKTNEMKGIQIGLYNTSNSRGLQLGFWNTNQKRTMPFINW